VSFSVPLPFDPIRRAAELWRGRWGPQSQFLAMASATSVMRVQQLLLARFDTTVGRHGLTFARYEALVLLAFSREGRLPMSKVGERLMVHPTSATNIIQRLAAQGLVDRSPNPADGRGTLASITPSGREVMESATRDLVEGGFGLGALDPQELEQLFRLLRKVRLDADDFEDDLPTDPHDHDVAQVPHGHDVAQDPAEHVAPDPADEEAATSARSVPTPGPGGAEVPGGWAGRPGS
jgi:DNA-binding MarR family transcriptional regulator